MQWPKRFIPGKLSKLSVPNSRKQPRRPQLQDTKEKLSKVLAAGGVAPYNKCHSIVLGKNVKVNGTTVIDPTFLVDVARDRVLVRGRLLQQVPAHLHIAVHKQQGISCSNSALLGSQEESIWTQLRMQLPELLHPGAPKLSIVSRLDTHSGGLQLMTSDSMWAEQITRSAMVHEEYVATLQAAPGEAALAQMRAGMSMEGVPFKPEIVEVLQVHERRRFARLRVVVAKGRSSDVRALCEAAGQRCLQLTRIRVGGLKLPSSLGAGMCCHLGSSDIRNVQDVNASRSLLINQTPSAIVPVQEPSSQAFQVPRPDKTCTAADIVVVS